MKWIQFTLLLLFNMACLTACTQSAGFHQVNATSFNKLILDQKGSLIDVRTLREFKNGHIENAGQLNYYAGDFRQKLLLLPKDQPVFLYCNTGYRSERAAKILAQNGYTEIFNLEHGILEWNIMNLPVIIDPDASPDKDNLYEPADYQALMQQQGPVLIDFYAPWCAPCRKMMPMIDSIQTKYHPELQTVKINVDASKQLAKQLQINSVPLIQVYNKGRLVFTHNGYIEGAALEEVLKKHLKNGK
jgi:thioredoxin